MREAAVRRQIREALSRVPGAWFVPYPNDSRSAVAGVPDVIGCYLGRLVAFEVKRPDAASKPSALQRHRMDQIREAGGVAAVVRSKAEALAVLDEIHATGCARP